MKDLFETIDQLPEKVQVILSEYQDKEQLTKEECEEFQRKLKPHLFTFDYDFTFIPFNLRKMILGEYEKLAKDAYRNTSFDPERRAFDTIASYSEQLESDLELIAKYEGDVDRYKAKYIDLFTRWMSARSRCYSVMITGGSNFNNSRHEKANNAEHNRAGEFFKWREKVLDVVKRKPSTDIVKGSSDALDKMNEKLEKLEAYQEQMKAINAIVRNKKLSQEQKEIKIIEDLGWKPENAAKIFEPDYAGRIGIPKFALTNNGAQIRNLKKDIESEVERLAKYQAGNKEYQHGTAQVVENVEENRLQLFFEGKPSDDIRTLLKSKAFKWSPRNGCWQRQLTDNAIWALKKLTI